MLESSNIVGLICAAGVGSRMGLGFPKQYLRIAGVPIVVHTARALASVSRMSDIVIVVSPTDPYIDDITPLLPSQCRVIKCGGDTRAESVRNGLLRSGFGPTDWVLVHDAARPCVKASEVVHLIDSVTQDMSVAGGILAMPAVDTLKRVDEARRIVETVDRKTVWRAATPQMFRVRNLSLALSGDLSDVTDEASAIERLGLTVKIVPCRTSNIKVTEPSDASLAKYLLGEESMLGIRVGQGYDSHRLVEGRPLIIGGVTIPYEKGLDGHSDADVLLHAITDAVLGAAALGDIGQHFPPTEERWKGADSRELLKAVVALAREHGWDIVNCDATVVAERPKLAPYNAAIRESVAQTLGITIDRVNIKAKTNEKLDDVGAQLGMMAHAVVLLQSA
ncbi:MAG: 2-C-methyl-D-erythritol 2,4-cyclodiphosphate synthase [Sutterella sp.]|nr:2-C-methyl-D-erythritol 2,4-cyclodiphosphate synthase [Sutterella sp.]